MMVLQNIKASLSTTMFPIDITPGVCGDDSHALASSESGSVVIGGRAYYWNGGCSACVDEKIASIQHAEKGK